MWTTILVLVVLVLPLARVVFLVLVILMPFGGCLLDPPCVFVGVADMWVLPHNLLLQICHSLEMSVIEILGSLDCSSMHMLQLGVSHFAE